MIIPNLKHGGSRMFRSLVILITIIMLCLGGNSLAWLARRLRPWLIRPPPSMTRKRAA